METIIYLFEFYFVGFVLSYLTYYVYRKIRKENTLLDINLNYIYGFISWFGLILSIHSIIEWVKLINKAKRLRNHGNR